MNYVTYPHYSRNDADLRPARVLPAARAIGRGLMVLGGGILFAATVYVMIVLLYLV